jgi:hypothetical protein
MADITGTTIIKSMGMLANGEQTRLSEVSGVDRQRVNGLINGRAGQSLTACKALASALEPYPNPHAMFLEGHVSALKNGNAAPEDKLRTVAFVLKTLAADEGNINASPEFDAATQDLHRVAEAALASVKRGGTVSGKGSMAELGRSSTGLKVVKHHGPRGISSEPGAAKKKNGRPARNSDGTSNRKLAIM